MRSFSAISSSVPSDGARLLLEVLVGTDGPDGPDGPADMMINALI